MKAFVLISLSDRSERNVVSELKTYPEIRNAYILFGAVSYTHLTLPTILRV